MGSEEPSGQIQAMIAMGEALIAWKRPAKAKPVLDEAMALAKDGAYESYMNSINSLLSELAAAKTLSVVSAAAAVEAQATGDGMAASGAAPGQAVSAFVAPDVGEIKNRIQILVS